MNWLPNLVKESAYLIRELRLLQSGRFYLLVLLVGTGIAFSMI